MAEVLLDYRLSTIDYNRLSTVSPGVENQGGPLFEREIATGEACNRGEGPGCVWILPAFDKRNGLVRFQHFVPHHLREHLASAPLPDLAAK